MDLSTKLPAQGSGSGSGSSGEAGPRLVVGSLDLNVGAVLPAEELRGQLPSVSGLAVGRPVAAPQRRGARWHAPRAARGRPIVPPPCQDGSAAAARAYLSNVCVAAAARRRGVGRALIRFAEAAAHAAGVRHLYVHVVADNTSAESLYTGCGFEVESEESEAYAHGLRRPRRKILHKQLSDSGGGSSGLAAAAAGSSGLLGCM
jgi:ribosomal protein S18 acetylase RimI-like enzyme